MAKSAKTLKDWNIFQSEFDKLEKWSSKEMDFNQTKGKINVSALSALPPF